RVLHQSDVAGGSSAGPQERKTVGPRVGSDRWSIRTVEICGRPKGYVLAWNPEPGVWYVSRSASGNNSVVECDLAKVGVAGSNPVSRSNLRSLDRRLTESTMRPARYSAGL